jgi:hypothetical protein
VAQEHLLGATTVGRPQCPIVRRIQIEEAKAFDWALNFQSISLNDGGNPLSSLLSPVGIKLDAVAKHLRATGDNLERHAIANTWVDRGRWCVWKAEESTNPLSFRQWQRVKAEATFALETQGWAPLFEESDGRR